MKKIIILVLAIGIMVWGIEASAQQSRDYGTPGRTQGAQSQSGVSGSAMGYQGMLTQPQEMSKWMGKEVKGVNGEDLGKIKDFVINPQGRIQFALLSTSAMGGKLVAVPFEALFPSPDGKDLALNISKDKLANAPEFRQDMVMDRTWSDSVYRYYGVQPRYSDQYGPGPQRGPSPMGGQSSTGEPPQSQSNESQSYQGYWRPDSQGLSGQSNK